MEMERSSHLMRVMSCMIYSICLPEHINKIIWLSHIPGCQTWYLLIEYMYSIYMLCASIPTYR